MMSQKDCSSQGCIAAESCFSKLVYKSTDMSLIMQCPLCCRGFLGLVLFKSILEIIYDNDFKYESFILFYNFIGGGGEGGGGGGGGVKLIQIWCEH